MPGNRKQHAATSSSIHVSELEGLQWQCRSQSILMRTCFQCWVMMVGLTTDGSSWGPHARGPLSTRTLMQHLPGMLSSQAPRNGFCTLPTLFHQVQHSVARCAVLCCAVLCFAVLCCTALCRAVLHSAMLHCAGLCCAALCCAVLHYAAPRY